VIKWLDRVILFPEAVPLIGESSVIKLEIKDAADGTGGSNLNLNLNM
jgi:hypothetical protein